MSGLPREFYRLHERLIADEGVMLKAGPCRCGHEAEFHHGTNSKGCRGLKPNGAACVCRRYIGTVVPTERGAEWLRQNARWGEIVADSGLAIGVVERMLKKRYGRITEGP